MVDINIKTQVLYISALLPAFLKSFSLALKMQIESQSQKNCQTPWPQLIETSFCQMKEINLPSQTNQSLVWVARFLLPKSLKPRTYTNSVLLAFILPSGQIAMQAMRSTSGKYSVVKYKSCGTANAVPTTQMRTATKMVMGRPIRGFKGLMIALYLKRIERRLSQQVGNQMKVMTAIIRLKLEAQKSVMAEKKVSASPLFSAQKLARLTNFRMSFVIRRLIFCAPCSWLKNYVPFLNAGPWNFMSKSLAI